MASSSKLSHAASTSHTGAPAALPDNALFEVLLRLPAKDLCRLRAIRRSWRALTSDPHFATEHKSRHAEPLFAVTYYRDGNVRGVAIVGLSGHPLRWIPLGADQIELLFTHLDRLCVIRGCKPSLAARILNPATGVAITLPGLQSEEYVHKCKTVAYAFGQVACTGNYKVLRISNHGRSMPQLCDIITLDSGGEGRWRRKQNPPRGLKRSTIMAVNGIVYFLLDFAVMGPASTAPFNLDTEEWMPTLQGPEPLRSADFPYFGRSISLANLNGSLVIVDNDVDDYFDLWFLMDHNRGLWVKKYRISAVWDCFYARPLLMLDDGRIVIYDRAERLLQCYDPATDTLTDVLNIKEMGLGETPSIGVYTGSLLI